MDYKVVVTKDAEENLERFLKYLIIEKENSQAAENMLNDYDATIESLKHVAGSLKLCDNPRLRQLEYRRINFLNHIRAHARIKVRTLGSVRNIGERAKELGTD